MPAHRPDARRRRRRRPRALPRLVAVLVAVGALAPGCAVDPARYAETERAWAQRDAERAAECAQRGGRYVSSSCLQGGGP